MRLLTALLIAWFLPYMAAAEDRSSRIQREVVIQSTASWDGTGYASYPPGQPQLTIVKITIPPHTKMDWHSHSLPNAAYILSGELTIELKSSEMKKRFSAGQAVTETVDSKHRGITGNQAAVLIVFYAGAPGLPLSE
jgi:quercetin dioxygenase-like cupin family protein